MIEPFCMINCGTIIVNRALQDTADDDDDDDDVGTKINRQNLTLRFASYRHKPPRLLAVVEEVRRSYHLTNRRPSRSFNGHSNINKTTLIQGRG